MSTTNKNTAETHKRFWDRMTELYGRKWAEEYGNEPPVSWRELIDRYTPRELKAGIDRLRMRSSQFVPTQPEVAQILEAAQAHGRNSANDPSELRRAYWRSTIVHGVANALGYHIDTLEPVLIANRSLGESMRMLLDEAVDSELRTGQRTRGQEDMVAQRCRDIGVAFNALKAAQAAA